MGIAAAALLWCGACRAAQPAVLMVDASGEQVSGARTRLGFERLPTEGEKAVWRDPNGKLDNIAIGVLAGGGLVGMGAADARAQAERNATLAELRSAMAEGERLTRLLYSALRESAEEQDYLVNRTIRADGLSEGHVGRALADPADRIAIAAQKAGGARIVSLSWDDRQPLLAIDLRVYAREETSRDNARAREKSSRLVRYVGHSAPRAEDPRGYWSADNGQAFLAEVGMGLQRMLPLAWHPAPRVPKVSRKETVALQVDGASQRFPGRLWKEEAGAAYLFNADRGITIVATGEASKAGPAAVEQVKNGAEDK